MSSVLHHQTQSGKKPSLKHAVVVDLQQVQNPQGCCDYFSHAFQVFGQTICFIICLALANIIPIAMIVVGSVYLYSCPVEPNIPIFLIVGGVFMIVKSLVQILNRARMTRMLKTDPNAKFETCDPVNLFDFLLTEFLFIWLICGSVWVFRNYRPELDNSHDPNYCHRGTYLFAFSLLIIGWICVAIFLTAVCCITGAACCFGVANKHSAQVAATPAGTVNYFGQATPAGTVNYVGQATPAGTINYVGQTAPAGTRNYVGQPGPYRIGGDPSGVVVKVA